MMPDTPAQKKRRNAAKYELDKRMGTDKRRCETCEFLSYFHEIEPSGSPLPCMLTSGTAGNDIEPSDSYHAPDPYYEWPPRVKLILPHQRVRS